VKKCLLLPCLLLPFALIACGSSDSGGEAGSIEKTLEKSAASTDPGECTRFSTVAYLEQTTGLSGDAALTQCEKEVPRRQYTGLEILGVEVDGSTASAEVANEGSPFDGQKVKLNLVRERGHWKVDKFVEFVDFDRDELLEGIKAGLSEAGSSKPELAACLARKMEQLPQSELELLLLSAKRGERLSTELRRACS
jgi:hypothetical protein